MKSKILILIGVSMLLAWTATVALAHPMGNFSVNHNTSIEISRDRIRIALRIDIAEIPAVEEMQRLDANHDGQVSETEKSAYLQSRGREITKLQAFRVSGKEIDPDILRLDLVLTPGAGGLPTLLIAADYQLATVAGSGKTTLEYADRSFDGRSGWREITARADAGATIVESNVPRRDLSKGLSPYPAVETTAPPQITSARVVFFSNAASSQPVQPAPSATVPPAPRREDPLAKLLDTRGRSGWLILLSLPLAFALGAFHAMSPGHGKTIVAAYLVGARGTAWHAVLLGIVVTVTHTAGVFALGLVVLFAAGRIIPETLYPWLGVGSGLLIFGVGAWQFGRRWARQFIGEAAESYGDRHALGTHSHTHIPSSGLLALGVSGGIVPCPSALIVMLSAIALHHIGAGLILIVAFSFGLASVLIVIGLLVVHGQRLFRQWAWEASMTRKLQMTSSLAVGALGLAIVIQSLHAAGQL